MMPRTFKGFPKKVAMQRDDSYGLELRIILDDEKGNVYELKFTAVRELVFSELNIICEWWLVIEDISSNGYEDINYSITETEDRISFLCKDIYEYSKL